MSWLSSWLGNDDQKAAQNAAAASAAAQRAAEDKRQADIKTGQGNIDSAFSQFDPAYYDKFKSAYTGNYLPQVQDQYGIAKDKLIATLAGHGTLESTVGAQQFANLDKTRDTAQADIGNQATDASNALKTKVADAKSSLYGLNTAVADPQGMATQAIGKATSIAAPSALSPLGQVFASTLQGLGTYNQADARSMTPGLPWNQNAGFYAPTSGAGSSLMVR